MNEKPEICAKCGGECCHRLPGAALPIDFGLPDDTTRLFISLASGLWAIDCWEGDPRDGQDELDCAYFVRPATKGCEGILHDNSWGGECVFVTKVGCTLMPDARPSGCQLLEPKTYGECVSHGASKWEAAIAWLPFDDYLRHADKFMQMERI